MQEVEMMMTLTDVVGWPGYNEIIDISPPPPKKKRYGPAGLDWRGEGMDKYSLGILNYNEL